MRTLTVTLQKVYAKAGVLIAFSTPRAQIAPRTKKVYQKFANIRYVKHHYILEKVPPTRVFGCFEIGIYMFFTTGAWQRQA